MTHVPAPAVPDAARAAALESRLTQVRSLLDDRGAGGALLASRRNFAWLTAGGVNHVVLATESGAAPILVTRDDVAVLAPVNEAARLADEELRALPIEVVALDWFDVEAAQREANRRASGALVEDAELEHALRPIRSVLTEPDAERMAWLGGRVARAIDDAVTGAARGETEDVVAARMVAALAEEGIRSPVVLAAADARIERYRHPLPSASPVERRLMLVLVAERWGLHVAATRFREFEPPEPELARRIDATLAVQSAMHDATRPGITLGDVLDAAIAAYAATGHGEEWRLHHQGGTIGYQGRERIAVPGDETVIAPGNALAWNPSITGAKAEDTILIGPDGARTTLTR